MIGRQEILETAATLGLNPHVVEKDYVRMSVSFCRRRNVSFSTTTAMHQ